MKARLQYGPFDGKTGHVDRPVPAALDVRRCPGCGCGRDLHYRATDMPVPPPPGWSHYELVRIDKAGALYRSLGPVEDASTPDLLTA